MTQRKHCEVATIMGTCVAQAFQQSSLTIPSPPRAFSQNILLLFLAFAVPPNPLPQTTLQDWALVTFGALCALGHGALSPAFVIFFGDVSFPWEDAHTLLLRRPYLRWRPCLSHMLWPFSEACP